MHKPFIQELVAQKAKVLEANPALEKQYDRLMQRAAEPLPSPREKGFEYAELRQLYSMKPVLLIGAQRANQSEEVAPNTLVLRNGHIDLATSTVTDKWMRYISGEMHKQNLHPMSSLDASFLLGATAYLGIDIPEQTMLEDPLIIKYEWYAGVDQAMLSMVTRIQLGKEASAHIQVEHHVESKQSPKVFEHREVQVGTLADLHLQELTGKVSGIWHENYALEKQGAFHHVILSGESKQLHREAAYHLRNAEATLELYAGVQGGVATNHAHRTWVHHEAPHTTSTQHIAAALEEEAKALYHGTVQVYPGADGSTSDQRTQSYLLHQTGHMHADPRLIVDTDEVSCTHGAAIGQFREEDLQYFASRGIGEMQAKEVMARGALSAIYDRLD